MRARETLKCPSVSSVNAPSTVVKPPKVTAPTDRNESDPATSNASLVNVVPATVSVARSESASPTVTAALTVTFPPAVVSQVKESSTRTSFTAVKSPPTIKRRSEATSMAYPEKSVIPTGNAGRLPEVNVSAAASTSASISSIKASPTVVFANNSSTCVSNAVVELPISVPSTRSESAITFSESPTSVRAFEMAAPAVITTNSEADNRFTGSAVSLETKIRVTADAVRSPPTEVTSTSNASVTDPTSPV